MELNDFISKEEIKKEMEKKPSGTDADSRYWRVPDGKSTIRLLPRLEARVPWKTVYSHRRNKNGEKLFSTCLLTFGKKGCPLCAKSWEMHGSEIKEIRDEGYDMRKSPRHLFNAYIVNDTEKPENNGTVKILSVGKKLFDLIMECFNADDLGDAIFDATNGFDLEINRKQSGDNPAYPDYSSSRFILKKYGIVKDWKAITGKLINLDEMITEEPVDEMKKKWAFLGFADVPVTAPKVTNPNKKQEKKEEVEEDIESLTADDGEESVLDDGDIDVDGILEDEIDSL
jgi:hypothetical protein